MIVPSVPSTGAMVLHLDRKTGQRREEKGEGGEEK